MSKYIIKNCPCYWHIGEDDGCSLGNMKQCEDDTDCVMKQIVELCKNDCVELAGKELRYDTLDDILELLDIQEVE